MKKIRLMMAVLTFAAMAGSLTGSHAACASTNDCDPFGGYEAKSTGNAKCAPGATAVPMVGSAQADPSKGLYFCNDGSGGSVLSSQAGHKVEGRIFLYKDSANGLHLVIDGDDRDNSDPARGWDRWDLNTGGHAACWRRGGSGQAWNTNGSSDKPTAPPSNGSPICSPA